MAGTLKSIAGLFVEKWRDPVVCEGCGNEFTCGASLKGCWCSDLKLSDEARSELANRYSRCLCRNCLQLHSTHAEEQK